MLDKDDRKKGQQQYEYFPTSQAPMKKLDVMPPSMPIRQVSLASADQVLRPSACQVNLLSVELCLLQWVLCDKTEDKEFGVGWWILYWVLSGHTFGCLVLRKNQHEWHISMWFGSYLAKWIYSMHVCERWVFWSVSKEQVKKQSSSQFGDLSPVHEFHLHYLFFAFVLNRMQQMDSLPLSALESHTCEVGFEFLHPKISTPHICPALN